MKYSPRVVSSCESCRRLKRKCDYTSTRGPCSNCVMRNIGHLCSLPGEKPGAHQNNVSNDNTPRSLPSPPGSSYSNNYLDRNLAFSSDNSGATSNATSPSQRSVFSSPLLMPSPPSSDIEKQSHSASASATRMPPKFLLACAVRFFQTPELSYYLDEYEVMSSIFDLARGLTDLNKLSLLYILCADILLRRGAQVSALFGFTGNRFELANELVDIHLKTCQLQPTNTVEACRALLLRGQFYTDSGNEEQGFKALDMALSSFNSIIQQDQITEQTKGKLWLGICTLEGTLCVSTKSHRRPVLPLQRSIEYSDFKDLRRMQILQYSQRVSNILDDNENIINDQQIGNSLEDLCIEMNQFIPRIDEMEGKLHPYGQVEIYISLIKIRTRQVLELGPNTQYQELRDSILKNLMEYSNELANRVEIFSTLGSLTPYGLSCLASGPHLAYTVFQGLTCIWILATLTDREFLLEPNFGDVRTRIFNLLDNLKGDYKICKHTHGLFKGLEILAQAQRDEESGSYTFRIPVELESGISSISKKWNEGFGEMNDGGSSVGGNSDIGILPNQPPFNDGWSEFNPLLDDTSLWTFILAQKDDFDTSVHSFAHDLQPNAEMVVLS